MQNKQSPKSPISPFLALLWGLVLLLQGLVWANMRHFLLPRTPTVELSASLLQDTLWIPVGLVLPVYLFALGRRQLPSGAPRRLLAVAALLLFIWALIHLTGYFRWLFLLLLLLALLAGRLLRSGVRLRRHFWLYLASCLALVLNYRGQLLPSLGPLYGRGPGRLKILDYSISGNNKQGERDRLFALIGQEDPEIIFIQEITSSDRKLFQRRLGQLYPHQIWADRFENYNGGAILSKLPFKEDHNYDITTPHMSGHININHAVITVMGRRVHLFNGHLYPAGHAFLQLIFGKRTLESSIAQTNTAYLRRMVEAEKLREIVTRVGEPVIVGGDFNDTPNSPLYRSFSAAFQNAHEAAGWGLGTTYGQYSLSGSVASPLRFMLFDFLRIDHLFASREFRILEARVIPFALSDHKPQVVRLALY